jgi:regulator of protease activity HflC (stomatin/prohibitin superfamily)
MTNITLILSTIVFCFAAEKLVLLLGRLLGIYTIVHEREAKVFVLFGEILGIIDEPGIHFLWSKLGFKALFVNWLGTSYTRSLSLDQKYLRSIPVNSEEGTPMGIGVWYEMYISDPIAHIFKNVDPEGSLTANVKNDTIKSLSNLPLSDMLVNRHQMSGMVRREVTSQSAQWGYKLGSVYIRKVHFRDDVMIRQIEEKVVNQLRQVTSAIEQDGVNQVNVIASKAEQVASIEFAKAAAIRPQIVGATLQKVSRDPEILDTLFKILEYNKMIEGQNELTLIEDGSKDSLLTTLMASQNMTPPPNQAKPKLPLK